MLQLQAPVPIPMSQVGTRSGTTTDALLTLAAQPSLLSPTLKQPFQPLPLPAEGALRKP